MMMMHEMTRKSKSGGHSKAHLQSKMYTARTLKRAAGRGAHARAAPSVCRPAGIPPPAGRCLPSGRTAQRSRQRTLQRSCPAAVQPAGEARRVPRCCWPRRWPACAGRWHCWLPPGLLPLAQLVLRCVAAAAPHPEPPPLLLAVRRRPAAAPRPPAPTAAAAVAGSVPAAARAPAHAAA